MSNKYQKYLQEKEKKIELTGIDIDRNLVNSMLFDYQKDIVIKSLKTGRSAIFADTGLGKTAMLLEWCSQVQFYTKSRVIVVAPLAVGIQLQSESNKFGYRQFKFAKEDDSNIDIVITNYDSIHKFDSKNFAAICLDESSILKGYNSSTRYQLNDFASSMRFRLACTATPSPNDLVEITNHAEFLGINEHREIIAKFFRQNGNSTTEWRLKKPAIKPFYRWLSQWAIALTKPSDLGYDDSSHILPDLKYIHHVVESESRTTLFPDDAKTLADQRLARKETLEGRVKIIADMVNSSSDSWLIWCDLNIESEMLKKAIADAVEVKGSDKPESKEDRLIGFADGKYRVLVTKPSIAGFGLNLQVCHNMAFCGIGHSFEQFYQAVRRCWRFGQTNQVSVHIVTSDRESLVTENINRKQKAHKQMIEKLIQQTQSEDNTELAKIGYQEGIHQGDRFTVYLGDNIERIKEIEDDTVGLTVTSVPFPGMYAYTDSVRDMGNLQHIEEFRQHFNFLIPELLRVTMPGRLCCIHMIQLPAQKNRDGFMGLKDYRGSIISSMSDGGWNYAGEVTIDKDPQALKDGTKVLTSTGWMSIENISIGDYVVGSDGTLKAVTNKLSFTDREMYKVQFSDNNSTICDSNHLWTVNCQTNLKIKPQVKSTGEMYRNGVFAASGRSRYGIPLVEPVRFGTTDRKFVIHPYLLGVLIGDGCIVSRGSVSIGTDKDVLIRVSDVLPENHSVSYRDSTSEYPSYFAVSTIVGDRKDNLVLSELRELGLFGCRSWEKFIPIAYLNGSIESRKELLRGLLDTDGTVKRNGAIVYTTTSPSLADEITYLVQSIGGLTTSRIIKNPIYKHNGESKTGRTQYQLNIQLQGDWCPFSLARKAEKWKPRKRKPSRSIVSIEKLSYSSNCTCISIDSEDNLYVTEGFVLTHNCQAIRNKDHSLLFKSLSKDSSIMRMGLADYLLYFRKPGVNPVPIMAGMSDKYNPGEGWITQQEWIEWAAPVWYRFMNPSHPQAIAQPDYPSLSKSATQIHANGKTTNGIDATDVLNVAIARGNDDERHLCPLQLSVIERAVKLWSAPGDLVLDPFSGVGSTGYKSLLLNRRYIGIELKPEYFLQSVKYLSEADRPQATQATLF